MRRETTGSIRPIVDNAQRREAGCIGGRMQRDFHHGLLLQRVVNVASHRGGAQSEPRSLIGELAFQVGEQCQGIHRGEPFDVHFTQSAGQAVVGPVVLKQAELRLRLG